MTRSAKSAQVVQCVGVFVVTGYEVTFAHGPVVGDCAGGEALPAVAAADVCADADRISQQAGAPSKAPVCAIAAAAEFVAAAAALGPCGVLCASPPADDGGAAGLSASALAPWHR